MAVIAGAAHLNTESVIGGDRVELEIVSFFPRLLGSESVVLGIGRFRRGC